MNSPCWSLDPFVFLCPYNPQLPLLNCLLLWCALSVPTFLSLGSVESLYQFPKNHPIGKRTKTEFVYLSCWTHRQVNLWKVRPNLGSPHFFTPRPTSDSVSPCLHCYTGIWHPLSFQFALIWLAVRLSIFSYVYGSLDVFFVDCLIHTLSYFNWDAHHFLTDSHKSFL